MGGVDAFVNIYIDRVEVQRPLVRRQGDGICDSISRVRSEFHMLLAEEALLPGPAGEVIARIRLMRSITYGQRPRGEGIALRLGVRADQGL